MPYALLQSYEGFLAIIKPFVNDRSKLDIKVRSAPVNVKAIKSNIPRDEGCKIFCFDLKKGELWFTDIATPFQQQSVTVKNYKETAEIICQKHVYLMVGKEPICYLPFKHIVETALADLTIHIADSYPIIEIEGIPGIQSIIVEYLLDAQDISQTMTKLGFFKPPFVEKQSKDNDVISVNKLSVVIR
jgi:hypothetical protein